MKKSKVWLSVIGLVIVVAVVSVSVSHGSKSTTPKLNSSSTSASATNSVTISNYMFTPASIKIKAGTTVTWTNKDGVNHTVTADNSSSDAPSSMDIAQGKSYSFTFKKAGTYTYHCFPHPYMHGTVVVE